jgi:hypothetical protein
LPQLLITQRRRRHRGFIGFHSSTTVIAYIGKLA